MAAEGSLTMPVERVSQRSITGNAGASPAASADGGARFETMLTPGGRLPPTQAASVDAAASMFVQAQTEDALARQQRDRNARSHALAMLKALGCVQLALLGADEERARDAVQTLAETARNAQAPDDPVLKLILREIGVRAAVELARGPACQPRPRDVASA